MEGGADVMWILGVGGRLEDRKAMRMDWVEASFKGMVV